MSAPATGRGGLIAAVHAVLQKAVPHYEDDPRTVAWLTGHLARLDEPLRIAVAGKVKAGKSTLLNALVGEQVAPTDAGECTQVVTWYRDGRAPRIVAFPRSGPPVALPVDRRDGALVIDLQGRSADELDRMVVDWPSQSLRAATLIDTPGTASLSTGTSRRTVRFLHPDDDTPTEADAVIYLMRQLHASDAEFLEAFRDQGVARAASVNTVAVISRADEIGGGRPEAMISARAVAARYRTEPALRGLCQNVVAVAGLVAQTGRTLRQAEFGALRELAAGPREDLDAALLTADRFTADSGPVTRAAPGLGVAHRRALLARFGLFGLRLSTMLIRQGLDSPAALATELVRRSGLEDLQRVLHSQFAERRDLLKARSALLALERLLRTDPRPGAAGLVGEVERIFAGAHEFTELRLLSALRSRAVALPASVVGEAERLLGDAGAAATTRLGLPADVGPEHVRAAALDALSRWQDLAENPMTARAAADACRVLIRTCEGLLVGAEQRF
ncbi:dynamin family protein [Pseudonocardia lacus]|uniref:dynamin family protein n=1 Tax=Pseudonocardia lacus TaxID=2835865 RepID=UPI001BDD7A9F|nr:dynamin family protein [Pseudonocardia lacus]